MKRLAICIPNYNRIDCLLRLLNSCIEQINHYHYFNDVQLCISDDFSIEDPTDAVTDIINNNPCIDIVYMRHNDNKGMDWNFHDSVMLSEAEYCWIIGNDDVVEDNGIKTALELIERVSADFYVTCFDIYSECGEYIEKIRPLDINTERRLFHSNITEDVDELMQHIKYDSGFFVFLSNMIFRRENWIKYYSEYMSKMDTMFIQVYIHVRTFIEGALYYYTDEKIIKNYSDDITNQTIKRKSGMAIGLNDVVDTFYSGKRALDLKKSIVDCYISGLVWQDSEYLASIKRIDSIKNRLYKEYFIQKKNVRDFFQNKEVVIWGAGHYGRVAVEILEEYGVSIIGIYDSDLGKKGSLVQGYSVDHIENMWNIYNSEVFIVVANHNYLSEMINTIHNHHMNNIAILT